MCAGDTHAHTTHIPGYTLRAEDEKKRVVERKAWKPSSRGVYTGRQAAAPPPSTRHKSQALGWCAQTDKMRGNTLCWRPRKSSKPYTLPGIHKTRQKVPVVFKDFIDKAAAAALRTSKRNAEIFEPYGGKTSKGQFGLYKYKHVISPTSHYAAWTHHSLP